MRRSVVPPLRTQVGDQQFRTVGLNHRRTHVEQLAVNRAGIAALPRHIVAQAAAERLPQRIDPKFRSALHHLFHAILHFGRILVPANLVGKRRDALFLILGEKRPALRLEDVDDRHVHHVVLVAGELRGDVCDGAFAFDEELSGDPEFLKNAPETSRTRKDSKKGGEA